MRKGQIMSEEQKLKIRNSNLGKTRSKETCDRIRNRVVTWVAWNKGVAMLPHVKEALRIANLGRKANSGSFKKGMISWITGKHHSEAAKLHLSAKNIKTGLDKNGYARSQRSSIVPHHRVVVERCIGRKLNRMEVVHHINENKLDNALENLFIFRHIAAHTRWHAYIRRRGVDGSILVSNLKMYE